MSPVGMFGTPMVMGSSVTICIQVLPQRRLIRRVFRATAITWELDDLYLATDQFDENGQVYRDVRNWNQSPFVAFREYDGLRLEVNRSFRDNWTLSTNYTWGEGVGNNFGRNDNTVLFDEDLFEGTGVFLLGAVLDRFFAKYVSVNSFTETVIKTLDRGEIVRWPAKPGRRHRI